MCNSFIEKIKKIEKAHKSNIVAMEIISNDYWRILLVEGDEDKEIYEEAIKKMVNPDSDFSFNILTSCGKENYALIKPFFKEREIIGILDRDHDKNKESKDVFYTRHYSIENYLLVDELWKTLIPSNFHQYFFNAMKSLMMKDKINKGDYINEFKRAYKNIEKEQPDPLDASVLYNVKLKGPFIEILKQFSKKASFTDMVKTIMEDFSEMLVRDGLKDFLKYHGYI